MTPQLAEQAQAYRILKSELIERYGFGEDDQVLLDSLEGATDYIDQLRTMLRFVRKRQRWIVKNKLEVDLEVEPLKMRNAKLQAQIDRVMARVTSLMETQGPRRLDAHDFSYSLVNGSITLVGDCNPDELPDEFVRVKREPNRLAILAALKSGRHVPGFSLSNGPPHLKVNP